MAYLKQLRLVLWKNALIRKRHWVLTLFEILLPIILFVLVSYSRSKISGIAKQEILDPTYTEPTALRGLQRKLQFTSNVIISFNSEGDLLKEFSKVNQSVIGIIFKTNDTKKLDYDIRLYDPFPRTESDDLFLPDLQYSDTVQNSYFQSGFLTVQTALDLSYIEMMKNGTVPVYLTVQEFPYPPYKSDAGLIQIFMPFLSNITIFSFIFLCPALIMRIVEEKSSGTRVSSKIIFYVKDI
ncbi:hypothetical protein HHI36_000506 [Cryptolaemus montrouzieri]|uniref:ABC transporter permease n=1 Tax=Cryptolaemus montrouzieri TaxID=559131 RepID=A0ABD2P5U9_9CUCU